jgi:hypothetical protein
VLTLLYKMLRPGRYIALTDPKGNRQVFMSQSMAAVYLGVAKTRISECVNGKAEFIKGYTVERVEKDYCDPTEVIKIELPSPDRKLQYEASVPATVASSESWAMAKKKQKVYWFSNRYK